MLKYGLMLLAVGAVVGSVAGGCSSDDSGGRKSVAQQCDEFKSDACGQCVVGQCGTQFEALCNEPDFQAWSTCNDACETARDKCMSACYDSLDSCENGCTDSACCTTCYTSLSDCESKCPADDGSDPMACYDACYQAHTAAAAKISAFTSCSMPLDGTGGACESACDSGSTNVCNQY